TGPEIQGREVDVYMWSCNDALKFGRRPVSLTVLRLGWNPRATTPGFMDRLFRRPADPPAEPLPSRRFSFSPGGPPVAGRRPPVAGRLQPAPMTLRERRPRLERRLPRGAVGLGLVLELEQLVVDSAESEQLLVRPRLAYDTLVEDQDPVHVLDR